MLKAFFDESGTDPKGPAFVMGGFLARAEEWERAADAWDTSLRDSPGIQAFHHVEARSLSGEFEGWRREDADKKVLSLAQTIARFDLQGFVTAISHSWFMPRDKRAAKGMFGTRIYDHAFLRIVSGVGHYVNAAIPGDDKVDFTFERRRELKECILTYEELFDSMPEYMQRAGSCIPGDDKTNVALQMADLLSWEFLQVVDRNAQSEAFKTINTAHPVFNFPLTPPGWFPYTLAIHSFGQSVKDVSDSLLKRIYGDKEKTFELVNDVQLLISNRLEFESHFKTLCEITGSMDFYYRYLSECSDIWKEMRKGK
jgi:hypothetical protein